MFKKVYSSLQIKRAIECYDQVRSFRKAALKCGISKSTIHRWYKTFHAMMVRSPLQKKKRKNRTKQKYPAIKDELKKLFESKKLKYLTLASISNALPYAKKPSLAWVRSCIKKCAISRRCFKNVNVVRKDDEEMKRLLMDFKDKIENIRNDEIVCIDETWFINIGNRIAGYFTKGQQPEEIKVKERVKVSVCAAISVDGLICFQDQRKGFTLDTFHDTFLYTEYLEFVKAKSYEEHANHKPLQHEKFISQLKKMFGVGDKPHKFDDGFAPALQFSHMIAEESKLQDEEQVATFVNECFEFTDVKSDILTLGNAYDEYVKFAQKVNLVRWKKRDFHIYLKSALNDKCYRASTHGLQCWHFIVGTPKI
ncbi:MAG: hypothetical protein EBU80_11940 [Chitinophagia bacterium]|nr:hypothetical protein [Chitinophagia bacterium]